MKLVTTSSMSARLQALPQLAGFAQEAEALMREGAESFWKCDALFRELCTSAFFTDCVNYELRRLIDVPTYLPAQTTEFEMLIYRSEELSLVLKSLHFAGRQNRLFGLPEDHLISVLGDDQAHLELYLQPQPLPNDVFDRHRLLTRLGTTVLRSGEVAAFRAATDIFALRTPPERPIIAAFLASRAKMRLRWEYDPSTLAPLRAVAADTAASRLEFTAWMLAELGDRSAVPALSSLLDHQDHFVRWSAVRAMFRLDAVAGREVLGRALHDPHEHVRNAASRSLAKLETSVI
jgi:hypothetical protein